MLGTEERKIFLSIFVTQKMNDSIHELTINDYDEVYRLWEQTEGLNLEEGHSREGIDI
jgi:hypothetical protein